MARHAIRTLACLVSLAAALGQSIAVYVAPFQSMTSGDAELVRKLGMILNLQIWQTLRIPPEGNGRASKGAVIGDVTSKPPTTYAEAGALAKGDTRDDSQIVVWGRAWAYANQNVVEPFLLIRRDVERNQVGVDIWRVSLQNGATLAVDVPRWRVDFAPIVLRADLLPGLRDPSGLKLYANPSGTEELGFVDGGAFRALVQQGDAAKVVLPAPDGRTGWIRLPNLSRNPSELVNFTGAIIRVFRQDWAGASTLFERVVGNSNAPLAVRIDSYLYMALCADKTGGDSYSLARKAYVLDPLSRAVIQYLCMSQLSALARMSTVGRESGDATARIKILSDIALHNEALFSPQDSWFSTLRSFLRGTPKVPAVAAR